MRKFSIGLCVGALVVLTLGSNLPQEIKTVTTEHEMNLVDRVFVQTVGPHWKPITDDVAIRVYTDDRGMRRATLGVMGNGGWEPVAVDGTEALLPYGIPVR